MRPFLVLKDKKGTTSPPLGALLQKILGGGPLLQLDHVECCNDEVRSSSSSESCRTHASGHVDTTRAGAREVRRGSSDLPRDPKVAPDIPWASPAASLAGR